MNTGTIEFERRLPGIPDDGSQSDIAVWSLVIPTKNGGEIFRRAVTALCRQTCWSQVDFVVVDSGSADDTIAIARSAGARIYQIDPQTFNHGLTRDFGISQAICERVVLMVQDAVAYDDRTIEHLLAALDGDDVGGAYARQIPQVTADVITKRNLDGWLTGRLYRENRQIPSDGWYELLSPIEKFYFCNFDNVCSAVKRSVWQQHSFGHINFGEDIDWAERVLKCGYRIVYEPLAAVVHSHDRPLAYEYKRTYVCHRKLYRQFNVHLVPTRTGMVRAWAHASLSDMKYILRMERRPLQRIKMLLRMPVLNFLSALGQYQAVRDEKRGAEKRVRGV